ncbi:methionine ABC transporter permease [Streptoalloteichus hindustanus]|uniref:D-methionine transport system permease protein n=1 Tax=Streptoalloteichus hindustanus TaxID=2017 RepID=A0A1M5KVY8_STRHI|nr:methionine ABC transporter permease [Streptoalloteichus hindustanus]SHG56895.1 D-methionine transport system permease protein [Streptoalloteichus hindustanus]
MKAETPWSKVFQLVLEATGDTIYMVGVATVFAALFGVPLGVLLHVTAPGGLSPQRLLHRLLSLVVDVGRSMPFIILLLAISPFTKVVSGTTLGADAAIVPLTVGAVPFVARLVDNALREVDATVVEAAVTTGASRMKIVHSVLLRESAPGLVGAIGVTLVALVGYSAMAGVVGAGGLGDLAIRYGYQRYDTRVMIASIVVLAALVIVVQFGFDRVARLLDRRRRVNA